uniref:Uncharacterized protein n=1 Tax=Arundo donax TaxID=35708 RepID=A0A0A9U231_ARUDO
MNLRTDYEGAENDCLKKMYELKFCSSFDVYMHIAAISCLSLLLLV